MQDNKKKSSEENLEEDFADFSDEEVEGEGNEAMPELDADIAGELEGDSIFSTPKEEEKEEKEEKEPKKDETKAKGPDEAHHDTELKDAAFGIDKAEVLKMLQEAGEEGLDDETKAQMAEISKELEAKEELKIEPPKEEEPENQEAQAPEKEEQETEDKEDNGLLLDSKKQEEYKPHTPDLNQWEELAADNSVVKKYIVYISKEFIPYIDNLTTDERSAYINDAIQHKIDIDDENHQIYQKKKMIAHFVVAVITFLIITPVALLGANKAIMMTFDNYKYSQDNFEKLYKQRFEKDKAYMRSLQYNKEHSKKK